MEPSVIRGTERRRKAAFLFFAKRFATQYYPESSCVALGCQPLRWGTRNN